MILIKMFKKIRNTDLSDNIDLIIPFKLNDHQEKKMNCKICVFAILT